MDSCRIQCNRLGLATYLIMMWPDRHVSPLTRSGQREILHIIQDDEAQALAKAEVRVLRTITFILN